MRFESKTLGTVSLKFYHTLPSVTVRTNNDLASMLENLIVQQGKTECNLRFEETEEAFFGVAHCAPEDQYKKETGRFLALGRAIDAASLSPAQTREVLAAYYGR